MKAKSLAVILVSLTVIVLTLGAFRISSSNKRQQLLELDNATDRGSIKWHAKKGRLEGKETVVLQAPFVEYANELNSFDSLTKTFAAIVAQPVKIKSHITSTNELYRDNEIRTWYKFKIHEKLSHDVLPQCSICDSSMEEIPEEMLPLDSDEILIQTYGGTVVVDGVTVSMVDRDMPRFLKSHRYLLFLQTDPSGKIGLLKMGPEGIYAIDAYGFLEPASKGPHPVVQEIERRLGNSLERLKADIQIRGVKK